MKRSSATLHALTSSALAIGAAGNAAADTPPEEVRLDYSFNYYSEDDIKSSDLAPGGDGERYEIEMHQFGVLMPVFSRFDLGLNVTYETMSGATPWYTIPDGSGGALQVMSGASGFGTEVEDKRTDILLSSNYYLEKGRVGLSLGMSDENDYEAFNWGLSGERHFNNKNTTLSGGLVFSDDTIEPTDANLFATRPDEEDKDSMSLYLGAAQILDRVSSLQLGLTYKTSSGYLDDPYKLAFVQDLGNTVADRRPDDRTQWSVMLKYRRHFERFGSSMHADYRFYWDDWGVRSHTLALEYHHTFFRRVTLIPSFRYYGQSRADFYDVFFATTPADGYHSSDFRLSPYGALTFGLRAQTTFKTPWTGQLPLTAAIALERYMSDGDYALVNVDLESPGLVSFTVLSFQLSSQF